MNPELEDYIEKHISPESSLLKEIDRKTNLFHLNGRMCSGHIQGRLLTMLVSMIKPKRVIELGTFTGYSALCMAEALEEDGEIHTIEVDDELEEEIISNFGKSPFGKRISLHIGDAIQIMESWPDNYFDVALIDADKRQYSKYFEILMRLIKPGGYIIADNTLWDGHVTENCKHSPQTTGILQFNELVASTEGVQVAIIPMRDGLTLIHKQSSILNKNFNKR